MCRVGSLQEIWMKSRFRWTFSWCSDAAHVASSARGRDRCQLPAPIRVYCIKGLRLLPPTLDFLIFRKMSMWQNFPVGFGVWGGLQSIGNGCGIQIERFSCQFEPCGSILYDFDIFCNFDPPEDNLLTIFRGSSEMVDFVYFDIFLTIFRGPSGIHQHRHFHIFLKTFDESGFSRVCRGRPTATQGAGIMSILTGSTVANL